MEVLPTGVHNNHNVCGTKQLALDVRVRPGALERFWRESLTKRVLDVIRKVKEFIYTDFP